MSLDQPMLVVVVLKRLQCRLQFLDGIEGSDPEQILLRRSNEALDPAIRSRSGSHG